MLKVWAIAILFSNQVYASTDWSLGSVVHQALQSSPLLVNQKIQYDLAQRDQTRRFIFNEPQLQYTNADDNTNQSWGVQLPVGIPGKAFALKEIDDAKMKSQRSELSAKRYDVVRTVAQAYLDCASSQASESLQKESFSDLDTVYKSMKASYESGHATQAEKIGSALQARQAASDLQTATDKKTSNCRKFLRLSSTNHEPTTEMPQL
ncbi:MAG TPA: TolC family protein, partial [Bdellovibrio sp.]|nr:TolC family protein [Bdellovibrio sp.]